jgi:hypothetical protein
MNLTETLISKNVFLVHCWSTCTGMSRFSNLGIYQKIANFVKGIPEACCSSIRKNDTINFDSEAGPCNFFGPVGAIICPGVITLAHAQDAGTPQDVNGYRTTNDVDISREVLEHAIDNRDINEYNEICVRKYRCLGLFYCLDDQNFLKAVVGDCSTFYYQTMAHNLPYYKMIKGELFKVSFSCGAGFQPDKNSPKCAGDLYKTEE